MAQTATQETTGATRIKGPFAVTLRGAESKGHDFTFGGVGPVGTGLDIACRLQVPSAQSANVLTIEKPDQAVIYQIDSNGNLAFGNVLSVVKAIVRVAISSAQFLALNTTPVALVAAPGAGKVLICDGFYFEFTYNSIQYTSGGVVNPVYHSATASLTAGGVAAASIQAAANYYGYSPAIAGATALALSANTGIDLYAATGNFSTGNSTAVVKMPYTILTLG